MFSQIEDKIRMADVLKLLGDLEYAMENFTSALKHYDEAIVIFDEFNDNIYKSYALIAAAKTLYKMEKNDEAEAYYNKALTLSRENEASFTLSSALYGLSIINTDRKNFKQAYDLLEESKKIALKEDYKIGQINAYKGLSKIYLLQNEKDLALLNINQALKIARHIGAMSYLQETFEIRSDIHKQRVDHLKALNDLKSAKKINDSLFSIKKTQRIEELKTIYETDKKEAAIALQNQEIKTLNEEAKNDKLTKTLYAGGMFSFLVLSGLLYFGFKQRIKKNKIEREKQEAIYKQEIAFKKKELASQTLHLVQKNTFIQELKENLGKIKQSPELFKVEFRRLVMLLKKESAEDKDWEVFKSYFAEVHNNFDNQLKSIYADITEKEIRLASFLRMNLSTKEIASMLNVLPDSVLKSKYRLKKKLKLDKDIDLNQFLNTL
jgi:tetratricopeptide (TPR) repeat protein